MCSFPRKSIDRYLGRLKLERDCLRATDGFNHINKPLSLWGRLCSRSARRKKQCPGLVQGKAGAALEGGNVVGAEEEVDALIEPELEVGRAAGGSDAFVVGAGGFDDAGGCLADGRVPGLAGKTETGGKVRGADEEIDARYGSELVEVLHRLHRLDLGQQAEFADSGPAASR